MTGGRAVRHALLGNAIEIGPGKVLSGLNRQIDRTLVTMNVEDPASLEKTLAAFTVAHVVSAEPHVPWELMIPARGGVEDDYPIGVSSSVGRWVHQQQVAPRQARPLTDSYVIAPTYTGKRMCEKSGSPSRPPVNENEKSGSSASFATSS